MRTNPEAQMPTHDEIKRAVNDGMNAFWAKITEAFPEVEFGDFGPEETFAFEQSCTSAVRLWLRWNHPTHMGRAET